MQKKILPILLCLFTMTLSAQANETITKGELTEFKTFQKDFFEKTMQLFEKSISKLPLSQELKNAKKQGDKYYNTVYKKNTISQINKSGRPIRKEDL